MSTGEMECLRETPPRKCDPDLRKTCQSLNKSGVGQYPYAPGSDLKGRYIQLSDGRENRTALAVLGSGSPPPFTGTQACAHISVPGTWRG